MFQGSIPALITPFRNGKIDDAAMQRLVDRQVAAGSHGLVPAGTTGESPTLSDDEHARVIALCVEAAAGRVPVIAGCGAASTAHAVHLVAQAKAARADAALVVTPYYNRPSQDGMAAHYQSIAEATDFPIVVYNVPSRTGTDLLPETVIRIAALPGIVGIKDASRDMGRVPRHRAGCPSSFALLSGDDDSMLGFNAMGGDGCISVTANVAPGPCAALQDACRAGDYAAARAINDALADLHRALFCEPSPAPTKYALSLIADVSPEARSPIIPLSAAGQAAVRAAMAKAGALDN
ncbi:MAG: 4-hydroxy-tetrahydrodipicolinate synthase [Alphaproteobacteria bacterium]|nr:4-hydroxy-tetrahydrodipicolinate synthase [Alphaproteobacteria bacterium]